jgi:hypothetical protein
LELAQPGANPLPWARPLVLEISAHPGPPVVLPSKHCERGK